MFKSWSFSSLNDFERCRFAAHLKHGIRVPEPVRELPPGKTEHANDRGTRVHTSAEEYVNGTSFELCDEAARYFHTHLALLRNLFEEGMVSLEGLWGYDSGWNPADWKVAWHRCKLDAMVRWSSTQATVIDYKTGKKFGNEIKHGEQLRLYIINTFLRFPELEVCTGELWYLDQNEVTTMTLTRDQALRFKAGFNNRAVIMMTSTDFKPNANVHSCKWCFYGVRPDGQGTGHCSVGVYR